MPPGPVVAQHAPEKACICRSYPVVHVYGSAGKGTNEYPVFIVGRNALGELFVQSVDALHHQYLILGKFHSVSLFPLP
ncbi:hypothetical protein SDC9_150330 [bioreactor metagenome]|uniref:Uncharacterized protein n=1 Tax=bioreactor metagenome TaxID=1076179 RepID=A0A645EMS2_9ZZZZ